MSSFSKTIAPGLRVGCMILPESIAEDLAEEAASTYITPSLLSQAIVHEFIARGSFEPNLRRMNELLKARRDAMLAALDKHFSGATWTRPEGGYFVWLQVPIGTNLGEALERAKGVTAVLGTEFSAPAQLPAPRLQLRVAGGDRGRRRAARSRDVARALRRCCKPKPDKSVGDYCS